MIIKEEKRKKNILFSLNKFLFLYFFITLIFGLILFGFILNSYTFQKAKITFLDYFSKAGRYEYLYLPKIALKALKSNFYKINEISLEINFDDVIVIENFRKAAIENVHGLGPTELIPRVKANIIFEGKKYRGDIRLKGDRKVHFEKKNKSSYKVELDRNQYLFGLKKFSIQKPRLRNYIHEWIFHEMARDFDIIKLKYEFINLTINGEDLGLYVIEEGFGKELIERNKRRNGPIFGIDEDISHDIHNPVFEIYNKKYWAKPENNALARIASQKLKDFFSKEDYVENIFDVEKWAAYFAVVDMTSTYHGAYLKSVKFYYNPINGLFEPIPFDGHRLKPNYHSYNLNYDDRILFDIISDPQNQSEESFNWIKKIFFKNQEINQDFYNIYIKKLRVISSKIYLDKFLNKNLKKIKEINSHIYSDYFYYDNSRNFGNGLYYFSLKDLFYQSENIQNKLKTERKTQVLQKNNSELSIKNYYKNYGLLIAEKIICNNNGKKIEIKINEPVKNFSTTIIKLPKEKLKDLRCTHLNLVNKFNENPILIKIDYINSEYDYQKFKNDDYEILDKYFTKQNKKLFLINDEIEIDQNLYIPKGYEVFVKSNQKIFLINNAFVISNSPWKIGDENGEVIITGRIDNMGGGILIGDNNKLSKIENTKISYLTGYEKEQNPEFLILGSINFHQTNVEIKNVNFENIYSEDAINIFRSSFKIINNSFKNISSDAIDVDFSDGEIGYSNFKNIRNDAIDFSGSKAKIYNSYFDNVEDKLVSAGENSKINISKIKGVNSHAGIISKDGSEVYSSDINFNSVVIPFAAYQKKKEYNHGLLFVKNYNINNFSAKWIKDKKSEIIVNNIPVEIGTKNAFSIVNDKKLYLIE